MNERNRLNLKHGLHTNRVADLPHAEVPEDREYIEALVRDASHDGGLSDGMFVQPEEELLGMNSPCSHDETMSELNDMAEGEYLELSRSLNKLRYAEEELLAVNTELAQLAVTKGRLTGTDGAAAVERAQATLARIVAADRACSEHAASLADLQQVVFEMESRHAGNGPRYYNFIALHAAQGLASEMKERLVEANRSLEKAGQLLEKCENAIAEIVVRRATS